MLGLVSPILWHTTSQAEQIATGRIIKEDGRMWQLDGLADNVADLLVINTGAAETISNEEPLCSDTDCNVARFHSLPDGDKIFTNVTV
jgi:hypothetical protein